MNEFSWDEDCYLPPQCPISISFLLIKASRLLGVEIYSKITFPASLESECPSISQAGAILSPTGHLAVSGDNFGCPNWGGGVLLTSGG